MASSAAPTQSASPAVANSSVDGLDEPEDAVAGGTARLRITLRLADIIQMNLVIGRSRFGQVKLAKSRQTGQVYALKALQKSSILELFELNHCKNERPVLQIMKHPYVVNLVSSFQDVRVIYFLMDYYPGGTLMRLLSLGKLSVSHARQITAQLIIVLEFMHNVGIVHRDLQPSNIIFDEQGFIRVCDFNSSVVLSLQKDGRAYSTVGCPFYMSPEVIKNRGHGFAADWWSLGCIVFEMLTGYPPFYDVNRLGCYQKILLGHVDFPPSMHPIAKDFVVSCLRSDEKERFNTGKTDVFGGNIIRSHPWFQDIDWDSVESKSFVPEWQPVKTLSGNMDLRYSSDVEAAPFADEYVTTGAAVTGSKKDSFIDF